MSMCLHKCMYQYVCTSCSEFSSRPTLCLLYCTEFVFSQVASCICGTIHRSLAGCDRGRAACSVGGSLRTPAGASRCGNADGRCCSRNSSSRNSTSSRGSSTRSSSASSRISSATSGSSSSSTAWQAEAKLLDQVLVVQRPHLSLHPARLRRVGVSAVGPSAVPAAAPVPAAAAAAAAQQQQQQQPAPCIAAPYEGGASQAACRSAPSALAPPTSAAGLRRPECPGATQAQAENWLAGCPPAVPVLVSATW